MAQCTITLLLLLCNTLTTVYCRIKLQNRHYNLINPTIPTEPISQQYIPPNISSYIPLTGQIYRSLVPVYTSNSYHSNSYIQPNEPLKPITEPKFNTTTTVNDDNIHTNAYRYNEDGSFDIDYYNSIQQVSYNNNNNNTRRLLQSSYIGDTLTGCAGLDFFVNTAIGSQTFKLIVDTGSSTTVVAGTGCVGCNVSPEYNNSGINTGTTASNTYGDSSSFSGIVYNDNFTVQGTGTISLDFVSITQASSDFFSNIDCNGNTPHSKSTLTNAINQGILGLAYPGMYTDIL